MTPSAGRIMVFDALRGMSSILIVFSHTISRQRIHYDGSYSLREVIQILLGFLVRVGVPGFVIVSAFFLTREELKPNRRPPIRGFAHRMAILLSPYLIWSTVFYILFNGTDSFALIVGHGQTHLSFGDHLLRLVQGRSYGLYFLMVLAQLTLLGYLGLGRQGRVSFAVLTVALFLQVFYSSATYPGQSRSPWRYGVLCIGWIFYYVYGRWLGANFDRVKAAVRQHVGWVTAVVILFGIAGIAETLYIGRHYGRQLRGDAYFWISVFNIFFVTWFLTVPSLRGRLVSWLAALGRYSYAIYLLHVPYVFILRKVLWVDHQWGRNSLRVTLLLGLACLIVPILVRILSHKLLPRRLDLILFGR